MRSNSNFPSDPIVALCSVGEMFGGVERHLLGMCEWLRREGEVPLLVLFHDKELAAQARNLGFTPVIFGNRGKFDFSVPRQMATLFAERGINLVHVHGYRAMVNVALAGHYHSLAIVRTVHGLVEPAPVFSARRVKAHFYNWLEESASALTHADVCYVTDDLRRCLWKSGGRGHTFTIYNGIDPVGSTVFPQPDDLAQGEFNFAAVGRVSPVKGLETAFHALGILDPSLRVVLNIIGTGPSITGLQNLAHTLKLEHRVRFLGFKDNIYDYLANVDALIMPSLHEGLPYTILESMSMGTPIIASRVGGLAEVLEDHQTALLVEPGDVKGWARAMAKFAKIPEFASTLGTAGRQEQERSFTLNSMGNSYWCVYKKKLEKCRNSPKTGRP